MNNSGSNVKTEETSFNGTSGQNQSSSSSLLPTSSGSTESGISFSGSKKPCIYVGNLTWVSVYICIYSNLTYCYIMHSGLPMKMSVEL